MNQLSWLRVRVDDSHPVNFWAGISLSVYAIFGGLGLYLAGYHAARRGRARHQGVWLRLARRSRPVN